MKQLNLEIDASVYVKLEALAGYYHVPVTTLISIFLDVWVGLTQQDTADVSASAVKSA